jgi:diaminohydroxyphosphoribosylaminopyrimidine deaminase/5-amino-6-(5-phosphoribosylamino)uracil reductase
MLMGSSIEQSMTMTDLDYLQLALQFAAQGAAQVSPNPLVGSVIVKDGEFIGGGYHRYIDLKHAEAWALEEAGARARGATVYVNLEPCSHQGEGKRTPPCTKALIEAGIKRVVASMIDPNPRVNGRGFAELRAAGIEVSVGGFEREARRLNEKYVKYVTTRLPFVHLKVAASLDGRIATRTGDARWVTGVEARAASQQLRHQSDVILVGINTVLADDPMLTDRTGGSRHRPIVRVVLDAQLRLPVNSQLVRTTSLSPLLVFTALNSDPARRQTLQSRGVEVIEVAAIDGRLDLREILEALGRRQLTSVVVEGGAEVAGSIIDERLADKVTFFYAPKIIGGRSAIPAIGGHGIERMNEALPLDDIEIKSCGEDWEVTGYPIRANE